MATSYWVVVVVSVVQLVAVVLGLLDHEEASVRDLALRALRQMLKQQTPYFGTMVETVRRIPNTNNRCNLQL